MNNTEFIEKIKELYNVYIKSHRRSSAKLVAFHGSIAADLQQRLGKDYVVYSMGFNEGKEKKISGRYMDKKVDVAIFKKVGEKLEEIGGIAVKSIMTNYAQNSNNYFENMLGETANLRSSQKLYFQVLILPETVPYFGDKKIDEVEYKDIVVKNEILNMATLNKYLKLSNDNTDNFMHTPNKSLLYLIKTTDSPVDTSKHPTRKDWIDYLEKNLNIKKSTQKLVFGNAIIYNDYEKFIVKVAHAVLAV